MKGVQYSGGGGVEANVKLPFSCYIQSRVLHVKYYDEWTGFPLFKVL